MCRVLAMSSRLRKQLIYLAASLLALLAPAQRTVAEEIRCRCQFDKPPWEAYGTRSACTALTSKGKTSCNISFGGTGADPNVIRQVTGINPEEYERQVHLMLIDYLSKIDTDINALSDQKYIRNAMPIFMRGAYLRPGVTEDIKMLDVAILTFVNEYGEQISATFRGLKPGFETKESGAAFSVGRGTVIVDYRDVHIVTVFLKIP